ncbi:DNA polymerase III delta subunit [hydrothermal vent metagenome]|uniref:DNA polymerase III delta subunit n=1 Tax=hydrothermal vent metagenome TaxID=652676 RepID=A0A3B1CKN3_9ZZZZ
MALKGSIQEFGLSEIFQLIFHQQKEGVLLLQKDKVEISICFKEGKIIRAYEGNSDEQLGQRLRKAEILTEDQVVIARYRQENTKKSLESVLVDLEFLPVTELKRLTRLFTEETIFKLFDWDSGEYAFEQKDIDCNPRIVHAMDTQFILMEAVRQIDEWPMLIKKVPSRKSVFEKIEVSVEESINKEEAPKSIEAAEDFFGDLENDGGDSEGENEDLVWLLLQIDGERSVQQIIDLAHFGAFSVYQNLVELLSEKKIREKNFESSALDFTETKPTISKKKILKYCLGVMVSLLSMGIFFLSAPSVQMTSLQATRSFEAVKFLSEKNERYFIRFALDLYYLKHNRYPDTLNSLVEEGFFGDKKNMIANLENWSYRLKTGKGDKFHLAQN